MTQIAEFVARAASQTGFERERYVESKLPTVFSNLVVVIFLGDWRSEVLTSSILLPFYLKKHHPGKYVIVCSWTGHGNLFPYADEYWSVSDGLSLKGLADKAVNLDNKDERFAVYARNLRKYFENVITWEDWTAYYKNGFTSAFLGGKQQVEILYPASATISLDIRKKIAGWDGGKLFIYPTRVGHYWHKQEQLAKFKLDFWQKLLEQLLQNHILPVIYQDYATYDLSPTFGDKCLYLTDRNVANIMGGMRLTGCVLDVYSGISKLALLAKCPFVVCSERQYSANLKDWELLDLLAISSYKQIFSFPTILENGGYQELIHNIVNIYKKLSVEKIPDSNQEGFTTVSYDKVRQRKAKRIGLSFIKVEKVIING